MPQATFLKFIIPIIIYILAIFVYPLLLFVSVWHVLMRRFCCACSLKSIKDEIAVVTGGAGGLGQGICHELAKQGCHIAIVDVNLSAAEELSRALQLEHGIKAKAYQTDVTDHEAVVKLNADISADLGDVTIVCNNAGIMQFSNHFEPDWQEVQRMINVNLTAHFWMNEVFLPKMKARNHGHIIAISSIAGLISLLQCPVYCATKFGVRSLMRSMRMSLKYENYSGIHATTIFPNFIATNSTVIDITNKLGIDKYYPLMSVKEAAKGIVKAVLRNDIEVVLPDVFSVVYRFQELLPTDWREQMSLLTMRKFSKNFYALREAKSQENIKI